MYRYFPQMFHILQVLSSEICITEWYTQSTISMLQISFQTLKFYVDIQIKECFAL